MNTVSTAPVTFTAGAIEEIKRLLNDPGFDNSNHLRIGVKGGGCSGLSSVLGFDKKTEKDSVYEANGIEFVMEKSHELYLAGMEIDWENGLNNRGFTFSNPNASSTCGCGSSFGV
ncbi:MAG TPA: iron-sulfur cluster assembly accessory protein [Flavisolibacter sp.]|nr:iron-sulfur cluster assembly accessory protein [Flavisolibacter sp.]